MTSLIRCVILMVFSIAGTIWKMNKIAIILICIWMSLKMYSQPIPCDSLIFNNDSIKFKLILITPMAGQQRHSDKTFYVDMSLSTKTKTCLLSLDSSFWISHLYDPRTDWATNAILHYIFNVGF
jgi:hypothetical protein